MNKSKFIVLIMVVFSLSLGGCSFFNGQSAKKQEMIQIAESKKAKDVIENLLRQEDPNAFTDKGVIKSYKINENSLKYNPMGGLMVSVVINKDNELNINYNLIENKDGSYHSAYYSTSPKLSKLLKGNNE